MSDVELIGLSQLAVYNPQRLEDHVLEKTFVLRIKLFQLLIEQIREEDGRSIPQHHLIIGQRGMGKSTMLKRIEIELRKEGLNQRFIPLLFPEEQYNLSNLGEFWLNCLDAMADTLEYEGREDISRAIDVDIAQLNQVKGEELAKRAYGILKDYSDQIKRRPILLVDNISLIFERFAQEDQHQFRAVLMKNGAPILISASATSMESSYQYGAPFYDAFKIHYLYKLTYQELKEVLHHLSVVTGATNTLMQLGQKKARIKAIHQLTGGNPRTAVILFKLLSQGFGASINDDLEALLDEITPLYKARFEQMPPQAQIIVDAIALRWDPIDIEGLRQETRLDNQQLSPQLKRLTTVGWIEKTSAYKSKGGAYMISERFFNIWFLMRRSSRRHKKQLICLSRFLETFYGDHIDHIANKALRSESLCENDITYKIALSYAATDKNIGQQLKESAYDAIHELSDDRPLLKGRFKEIFAEESNEEHHGTLIQRLEKLKEGTAEESTLLGQLYQFDLGDYEASKAAYLRAIEVDEGYAHAWHGLGNLYQVHLGDYEASKAAYLRAIDIDEEYVHAWYGLGHLYKNHLGDYESSKAACLRAIAIDEEYVRAWNVLGNLYQDHLGDYESSKAAYLRAIDVDEEYVYAWNGLGNLYQDHFRNYVEAKEIYQKGLKVDPENPFVKYNLVFLLRDKLGEVKSARTLFDQIIVKEDLRDSHFLNLSLFHMYDQNLGLAKEALLQALELVQKGLPPNTQDDWWRYASVVIKLGHGVWLSDALKEEGFHIILSPYYAAIMAINDSDPEGYLNSRAVEIREPAQMIISWIRKYID